jgi:hypothetical protein
LFFNILVAGQNLYTVLGNQVEIMGADGMTKQKTKGPLLLPMVPFDGSYITYQQLWAKLPENWPDWEQKVAGLGQDFWLASSIQEDVETFCIPFDYNPEWTTFTFGEGVTCYCLS